MPIHPPIHGDGVDEQPLALTRRHCVSKDPLQYDVKLLPLPNDGCASISRSRVRHAGLQDL